MNESSIKKLRRKFILTALISFVAVMLLMSTLIYIGNIYSTTRQVVKTLNYLLENDGEVNFSENDKSKAQNFQKTQNEDSNFFEDLIEDMFNTGIDSADFIHSVRYFSSEYNIDKNEINIIANHVAVVDENDASEISVNVLQTGSSIGYYNGYAYKMELRGNKIILVCVGISAQLANVKRIGNISLVILFAGSILAYIFVRIFSWNMIKPEIRAAEQQKQFITNASHELKTPLAVIRANTELEMMMHGDDEWNQSTMNQVDRMTGLIKELVMAAKAEESKDKKSLSEVDFSAVANSVADDFVPVAAQNGKTLERNIAENIKMRANDNQLRQLVTLLVDNAIKYCDDGGKIGVELSAKGKTVLLSVTNNYAQGKDVDYSKFFERFYRKDESHNIDKGGYGIGLSIADGIVRKYRGSINAAWSDGVIRFDCKLKG